MHVFDAFKSLIDNILLMDIFKYISSNDSMQICIHEIENQINITIVFSSYDILKSNNIFMTIEFLKENYFTECSLCIGGILESIEIFL